MPVFTQPFGTRFFTASPYSCVVEMVVIWLVLGMPEMEFHSPSCGVKILGRFSLLGEYGDPSAFS